MSYLQLTPRKEKSRMTKLLRLALMIAALAFAVAPAAGGRMRARAPVS